MENEKNTTGIEQPVDEKLIAIISYLTFVGWVIAYVMNNNNKSNLAIYHLRQSLFLMLLGVVLYIFQTVVLLIPLMGLIVNILTVPIGLGLLVFWVMGLISAINSEEKPLPLIGVKAQQIFSGIK